MSLRRYVFPVDFKGEIRQSWATQQRGADWAHAVLASAVYWMVVGNRSTPRTRTWDQPAPEIELRRDEGSPH